MAALPSLRLLCGLAVLEVGLVWLGAVDGTEPVQVAAPVLVAPTPAPVALQTLPTATLADSALARPLFAPDRRPVDAQAETGRAPTPPRLVGIVVAGPLRQAIFAGSGPVGTATSVGVGDRVGAFRVVAIRADAVEIDGPLGRMIRQPVSDPAPRTAVADVLPLVPLIDPVRREAETETDQ